MTTTPNFQGKVDKLNKYMINKQMRIPKFTYLFHSQKALADGVNKIEHLLYTFLWNNKRDKIKRTKLICTYYQVDWTWLILNHT